MQQSFSVHQRVLYNTYTCFIAINIEHFAILNMRLSVWNLKKLLVIIEFWGMEYPFSIFSVYSSWVNYV